MLPFVKYHGAGNDFVILDERQLAEIPRPPAVTDIPDLAVALCHRRFGVGADGILVVGPGDPPGSQASMSIWNSDGSRAEMCGNGLRCVVKHLLDHAPDTRAITVQTGAGPLTCRALRDSEGRVDRVQVDMGRPILERGQIPLAGEGTGVREEIRHPGLGDREPAGVPDARGSGGPAGGPGFRFTAVSMGNPHAVIFLDAGSGDDAPAQDPHPDLDVAALARRYGPGLEAHPRFPRKANISFVRRDPVRRDPAAGGGARGGLRAAVWERGAGLTAACGTGACAIAVAAVLEERIPAGAPVHVALPGGTLEITVAGDLSRVLMTGPARRVFAGDVDLAALTSPEACRALDAALGG